jgi:hypothetical protein
MGVQGGICDGWATKEFLKDLCAPAAATRAKSGSSVQFYTDSFS